MTNDAFNTIRFALLGLAGINVLLSALLVKVHLTKGSSRVLDWTCSGVFDCRSVLQSRYGFIHFLPPHPVPIAALGLAYYTLLTVWLAGVGRLPSPWQVTWAVPALVGLAGIGSSIWLLYIMFGRLRAFCGFCLTTHSLNLLLVGGLWGLWLSGPNTAVPAWAGWKTPVLAFAFGAAAALAEIYYVQTRRIARMLERTSDQLNHVQTDQFLSAKPLKIALDENDPVLSEHAIEALPPFALPQPDRTPHTAVIFSDFSCSSCAQMHQVVQRLRERLGRRLRIVHKDFPLHRACNPSRRNSPATDDPSACRAAAAAEAARRLGGTTAFARMADLFYTQQHLLPRDPYEAFAGQVGLNIEAFRCLCTDCQVREQVHKDAILGASLGVRATPTVFLDGRLLPNPVMQRGPQVLFEETVDHWEHLLSLLERYSRRYSK